MRRMIISPRTAPLLSRLGLVTAHLANPKPGRESIRAATVMERFRKWPLRRPRAGLDHGQSLPAQRAIVRPIRDHLECRQRDSRGADIGLSAATVDDRSGS